MGGGTRRATFVLVPLFALALVAAACGGGEEGGGGGAVDVTLKEFAIATSTSSASAGTVTFNASNEGPEDEHELVVIRTDLAITDLPTAADGSVDEEGEGIEVIGEIEEFAPGESESATFDLEAGSYVLVCNIYDPNEQEAHYQEGMRTSFTVE